MAGSWNHLVADDGSFIGEEFAGVIENRGDAYEACEECFGMIVWLTNGDPARIREANEHYMQGLDYGIEASHD